jgi:methionine synthase I (cobalamin-dependent)
METMMKTFEKTEGRFVRYPKNTEELTVTRPRPDVVRLSYRFNESGYDVNLTQEDARALARALGGES